jgi:hypothetical protein
MAGLDPAIHAVTWPTLRLPEGSEGNGMDHPVKPVDDDGA